MAFGMQIVTTSGLTSVDNLRSVRAVQIIVGTATSGSVSVSSAILANSMLYVEVKDGNASPKVTRGFDTVSWEPYVAPGVSLTTSTNFEILILRFR